MTKKEQIYEIAKYVCNACEFGIYRACRKSQTDVKSCSLALGTARRIYNAGYRKVPDGAVVLTPEERDDEMKATNEILAERDDLIAKVGVLGKDEIKQMVNTISEYEKRLSDKYIEIDNLNRDYRNAFERLKSQQQEIDRLKSENTQLKTEVREFEVELNARLTCDFVKTAQTHAVQDFVVKLEEKCKCIWIYKCSFENIIPAINQVLEDMKDE